MPPSRRPRSRPPRTAGSRPGTCSLSILEREVRISRDGIRGLLFVLMAVVEEERQSSKVPRVKVSRPGCPPRRCHTCRHSARRAPRAAPLGIYIYIYIYAYIIIFIIMDINIIIIIVIIIIIIIIIIPRTAASWVAILVQRYLSNTASCAFCGTPGWVQLFTGQGRHCGGSLRLS